MVRLLCSAVGVCILATSGFAAAADKPKGKKTASALQARAVGVCPAPLPAGFDWPAGPVRLWQISGGIKSAGLNIPGKIDMVAQRQHGWSLFAGATQPSDAKNPKSLPVFHTWYTVEEAFDSTAGKVDCAERNPLIRLTLPTQLVQELQQPMRNLLQQNGVEPSARFDLDPSLVQNPQKLAPQGVADEPIAFSHVAFNKEMYDYLRDNKYYSKAVLDGQIDANRVRKPLAETPVRGISLKFSWWPAHPDRLTPVPVWDFDPRFPGDTKNPPSSWKRIVAVDPVGGLKPPASLRLGQFEHANPQVIPIGRFYAVQVTAEEAALANADFRIKKAAQEVLGRTLQEGDYLLMTAMHIATREFEPWVWLTYWWTDAPGKGPLAQDIPSIVKGVWRNYVMDVSYNINNPKTSAGAAPVAYSPWLELFQLGGMRSQCMACHARSAYGPGVRAFFNPKDMATADPNGFEASPTDAKDSVFQKGTLFLQRVWTIQTRAQ